MTFADTIVKIMYIELGYLPNYPYHMITDAEMVEAFIGEGNYFDSMYYCPSETMREEYNALKNQISEILSEYLDSNHDRTVIPDWVYAYMLGNVTTYGSDAEDIEYLYELTNSEPNISYDVFDAQLAEQCLAISTEWLKKQSAQEYIRVPTMFGEPHVIKSLRLSAVDILNG